MTSDKAQPLDQIHINDLSVRCIIGVRDYERNKPQDVILNITLFGDFSDACQSDELAEAVDYSRLTDNIVAMTQDSTFNLVERLAQEIADMCLKESEVTKVRVRVEKPNALRFARSAEVEITRTADPQTQ